jgi:hypothetical protein
MTPVSLYHLQIRPDQTVDIRIVSRRSLAASMLGDIGGVSVMEGELLEFAASRSMLNPKSGESAIGLGLGDRS